MKRKLLPYNQPWIGREELDEVAATLKSGWLTMGPRVKKFENLLAEYTNAKHAVALSSCTAALHLSLVALGIGRGDEVITTPFTFAASANVIIHAGAKPVFVDIQPDTYNINPERIAEAITKKTKAILPVHFAGQPCNMKVINEKAEENNLRVIEDAAHAIGAEYEGRKIGTLSDSTCFSFYVTKNITTGEGGAVTTDNEKLADKLKILRLHGMSKDAWKRYSSKGNWYYEIKEPGFKENMSDISAAIGIHQIRRLDGFIETRRKYARIYSEELGKIDEVVTPHEESNVKHPYHLYPILLKKSGRAKFIESMTKNGVSCSVHFQALHLQPFFKKLGFRKGNFPVAEWVSDREVSLPLYPKMSEKDVMDVVSATKKTLSSLKL